jgi:hypothetical protein
MLASDEGNFFCGQIISPNGGDRCISGSGRRPYFFRPKSSDQRRTKPLFLLTRPPI